MATKKKPKSHPHPLIILRQLPSGEWMFSFPRLLNEAQQLFDRALDQMELGRLRQSAALLTRLIQNYPEHLDAYHHLALICRDTGHLEEARQWWEKAVKLALATFPARFSWKRDRLPWGFLSNRPFLRAYFGLAKQLIDDDTEHALRMCEHLLVLNPPDNQGVRETYIECCFRLEQPEAVVRLCKQFRDDMLPAVLYGRCLALWQLGRHQTARIALRRAMRSSPHVARELIKVRHVHPTDRSSTGNPGGDEAYRYWARFGDYWKNTDGAVEFVKQLLRSAPSK